jgi:transglutaminase-like putative cysteine protease
MVTPVHYRILHETRYQYARAVVLSQQLLHLTPRNLPWQRCLEHRIAIDPQPAEECEREDYFGNGVKQILLAAPHDVLSVRAESIVETRAHAEQAVDVPMSAWETLRDRLHSSEHEPLFEASHYLYESPQVEFLPELRQYARPSFPQGRAIFDAARELARCIHADFEFDSKATVVTTQLHEVFERRRGVCQDFAHLMIGCLRSLGLAARYVSGYILTAPPAGRPRLVGADASHAWASVYCGDAGWVDIDPTNNCLVDDAHITLAWGRDFSDVTPMRGVILGGGEQELEVHVTVSSLAEEAQAYTPDGRLRPFDHVSGSDA